MNKRNWIIVLSLLVGVTACFAQDLPPLVKIYLPREKTVAGPGITLDDIAMVTGDDHSAEQARKVRLGRAPLPGETITVNRQTIRARLASQRLYPEQIAITGARQVAIHRNVSRIEPLEMINLAEAYLQKHLPKDGLSWKLARKPKTLTLPKECKSRLVCDLDEHAPSGHVRILIQAVSKDKVLAKREVLFALRYRSQQVVATRDISPGETITPDNAKIEMIEVARKPGRWRSPFGSKAFKAIQSGAVVTDSLITRPKPKVLVRRHQTVRVKIAGAGWTIATLGTALQSGAVDEIIAVRNVDSRKVIQARVDEAGDVVPLLPGQ